MTVKGHQDVIARSQTGKFVCSILERHALLSSKQLAILLQQVEGLHICLLSGGKVVKKETQLGLSSKKCDDFSAWYSELVVASELISYYDVSGCYILRPWAFSM
jgi:hypothetical protein